MTRFLVRYCPCGALESSAFHHSGVPFRPGKLIGAETRE